MIDDLVVQLRERYTAEPVPPCRVCGEPLSPVAMGGGRATEWACTGMEDDPDRPGYVRNKEGRGGSQETHRDGHFSRSMWTQYRGGDRDVLTALDALAAATARETQLETHVRTAVGIARLAASERTLALVALRDAEDRLEALGHPHRSDVWELIGNVVDAQGGADWDGDIDDVIAQATTFVRRAAALLDGETP